MMEAATVDRPAKAAKLAHEVEVRQARIDELRELIVQLKEQEEEAVRSSLRTRPTFRPFGDAASPASKVKRSREKHEAELVTLEREQPFLIEALAEAQKAEATVEAKKLIAGLSSFGDTYDALWALMSSWLAQGVSTWLESQPPLQRERDEYVAAARDVILTAGMEAEWEDAVARTALGSERGLPGSFAVAVDRLVKEFHVRSYGGFGADLIRADPSLIRPVSPEDEGAAHEPPGPVRFKWVDLASAPVVKEDTALGERIFRDWNDPTTVAVDREPNLREILEDGSPRWHRVIVEEAV